MLARKTGNEQLGPPSRGSCSERDAADQADQQHQPEVIAPPAAEGSPEPVPGEPQDPTAHDTHLVRAGSAWLVPGPLSTAVWRSHLRRQRKPAGPMTLAPPLPLGQWPVLLGQWPVLLVSGRTKSSWRSWTESGIARTRASRVAQVMCRSSWPMPPKGGGAPWSLVLPRRRPVGLTPCITDAPGRQSDGEVALATLSLLLRARFRHRWRSWLLLCLLIALVTGLVLAAAVAGRRTATAFPRYEAAHGYDALVLVPLPSWTAARSCPRQPPVTGGRTAAGRT